MSGGGGARTSLLAVAIDMPERLEVGGMTILTSWPAIFLQDVACAALNGAGQETVYKSTQSST